MDLNEAKYILNENGYTLNEELSDSEKLVAAQNYIRHFVSEAQRNIHDAELLAEYYREGMVIANRINKLTDNDAIIASAEKIKKLKIEIYKLLRDNNDI